MLRILVAEDDPNHSKLARQALEDDGHEIVTVADGGQALDAIRRRPFDLVVLDMRLPVVDGREFIRRVRGAGAPYAGIPIVVVTGYGLRQHLDYLHSAGVHDCLAKPYDCDHLPAVVRRYEPTAGPGR